MLKHPMSKLYILILTFSLAACLPSKSDSKAGYQLDQKTDSPAQQQDRNYLTEKKLLLNNTWQLNTLNNKVVSPLPNNEQISFTLTESTLAINGFAGCNNYFSSYQLADANLSFDPIASTRRFCQDEADIEQQYLAMLAAVKFYQLQAGQLWLIDQQQKVIAIFDQT